MQLLKISQKTKLSDLTNRVGSRNVESILHANQLPRTPNIGQQLKDKCQNIITESNDITWQRKLSILNQYTSNSDIFETAALSSASSWKVISALNTLPDYLVIPDTIDIPLGNDVLGNDVPVAEAVYSKVLETLKEAPHYILPSIFNEYSTINSAYLPESVMQSLSGEIPNGFNEFKIPWGEIMLTSSVTNDFVYFPVYPESVSDKVQANYTTMPDLLYQYEPWQIYQSSGPRSNSYEFNFHRDMWGDHRRGGANALIRYCMANCYPNYSGALVQPPIVTLYVAGNVLIKGIMTDVSVDWDGPIGLDGWYLGCKLTLSITEVSDEPLNFSTVKRKPVIG